MKPALLLLLVPDLCLANCWQGAASAAGVDSALLKALAWKESAGRPDAVGPLLADGHRALGLMQINTIHLPALAKYGIDRTALFDACTSIEVGAWVLASCIRTFGATWKAVGCYYTGPASKNHGAQADYARDVQRYYTAFQRQELTAAVVARLVPNDVMEDVR